MPGWIGHRSAPMLVPADTLAARLGVLLVENLRLREVIGDAVAHADYWRLRAAIAEDAARWHGLRS
jgi:hypothetical protein